MPSLSVRRFLSPFVFLLACPLFLAAAPRSRATPFCSDAHCRQTRQLFRHLCDYVAKNERNYPYIFIGGYFMRDLVAGYEIFGDRRYLDIAIAYGDYLLKQQMPNGYFPTGYKAVYFADTGSALGLLAVLYKHVDLERQKRYREAVERYVTAIQKDGMINPDGSLDDGWRHTENGKLIGPMYTPYTLSTALTGAEVYSWMYHVTKRDPYRQVAYHALKWILSTMRSDGNIPYIMAIDNADWAKRGNPKVDHNLWNVWTYGTAAYVGEGVLSFDLFCGMPAWRKWIKKAVRPNIEFLLRNQLPDGTWSEQGQLSWDRTRSPGIADYLIWYYEHVRHDPKVLQAVRKYDAFLLKPQNAKAYGVLSAGAVPPPKSPRTFDVVTALVGRALADVLSPGVDARW